MINLKRLLQRFFRQTSKQDMFKLKQELEMAKRVQEGLLSVENPDIPGITIIKRCIPAESIGGDFYTFVNKEVHELAQKTKTPGIIQYIDSRETYLGIIIGDVAGHGVSSALVMALSSGLLSEIGKTLRSPAKIFQIANNDLLKYIENSQISHITAAYGAIRLDSKKLIYSNAGHLPIILQHNNGECEFLEAEGVFLGMFKDEKYEEKEIQLKSGDRLFFYTDGLTESRNKHQELFGTERLIELLQKNHQATPDKLLEIVFKAVENFSNYKPALDDRTLVIVEIA